MWPVYECIADDSVFHMAMKDLPPEVQVIIPPAGLPCSGTGITGSHCAAMCPFASQMYTEEWFVYEDENVLEFGRYDED